LSRGAWKAGMPGSEGAGTQQCVAATRRFRIQRRLKRGTTKRVVYTYPSKKALTSIVGRVRTLTLRSSHPTLSALLRQLNPVLRGWCTYFRHGVSKATFGYLDQYTWHRVVRWIRKRHNKTKWDVLYRRYLPNWRPVEDGVVLFQPQTVRSAATATGPRTFPRPGRQDHQEQPHSPTTRARGEPDAWRRARPVRRAG
jgi:hypothetical protein